MRQTATTILAGLIFLVVLATGCGQQAAAGNASSPDPTVATLEVSEPTPSATPSSTATPEPSGTPTATATATPTPTATPARTAPAERPVAIVVENDLPARPQAGLGDADVIYEAVAEFNLTRFVAIFSDTSPDAVGPIRSGRAYHGAIAAEYRGALVNCLDVPSLPNVIEAARIPYLDICRGSAPGSFWRDPNRYMPHNLYVSVPALREAVAGEGTYGGFAKRAPWTVSDPTVRSISFDYPVGHPVTWQLDSYRQEYLRWQDGAPHLDSTGRQITANSVIVQFVTVRPAVYFGEAGYHELTLTGEGKAFIYAEGAKRRADWRRGDLTEPTRFFDAQETEILLPPGRAFIQLVDKGTEVEESK